jgi:hypothetical protein
MKCAYFIFLLLSSTTPAQSQKLQDSTLFDFWIGDWDLTWTNAAGQLQKGTNQISKILDGKVIQENFSFASGTFKGTSLSVYNPTSKTWHQAWADTQGGYFDFVGAVEGDKRIFKTKVKEQNGQKEIQRMVFYNIKPASLIWDWESSTDGGSTWQLQWRINYQRRSYNNNGN